MKNSNFDNIEFGEIYECRLYKPNFLKQMIIHIEVTREQNIQQNENITRYKNYEVNVLDELIQPNFRAILYYDNINYFISYKMEQIKSYRIFSIKKINQIQYEPICPIKTDIANAASKN